LQAEVQHVLKTESTQRHCWACQRSLESRVMTMQSGCTILPYPQDQTKK
jgi:hypothetical protein